MILKKKHRSGKRQRDKPLTPRDMHRAVCSRCNKECKVPFEPTGVRPVYCKQCFPHRNEPLEE